MSLTITVKLLLWGFYVAAIVSPSLTTQVYAKFNVIVFLADDLGAAELGCYGNREHRTPNLDRMATEGLRLDTFYAAPLCTTTRMALMTGQYLSGSLIAGTLAMAKNTNWSLRRKANRASQLANDLPRFLLRCQHRSLV